MPINIANGIKGTDSNLQRLLDNMIKKYKGAETWRPQDLKRMQDTIMKFHDVDIEDIEDTEQVGVILEGLGYSFDELDKVMGNSNARKSGGNVDYAGQDFINELLSYISRESKIDDAVKNLPKEQVDYILRNYEKSANRIEQSFYEAAVKLKGK